MSIAASLDRLHPSCLLLSFHLRLAAPSSSFSSSEAIWLQQVIRLHFVLHWRVYLPWSSSTAGLSSIACGGSTAGLQAASSSARTIIPDNAIHFIFIAILLNHHGC
jgi:hypothetical protein